MLYVSKTFDHHAFSSPWDLDGLCRWRAATQIEELFETFPITLYIGDVEIWKAPKP